MDEEYNPGKKKKSFFGLDEDQESYAEESEFEDFEI